MVWVLAFLIRRNKANRIPERQVAWIRYQHGHSPVLNALVTKEVRLLAVPAVDVTLYKGKMTKETTAEDRKRREARIMIELAE